MERQNSETDKLIDTRFIIGDCVGDVTPQAKIVIARLRASEWVAGETHNSTLL